MLICHTLINQVEFGKNNSKYIMQQISYFSISTKNLGPLITMIVVK